MQQAIAVVSSIVLAAASGGCSQIPHLDEYANELVGQNISVLRELVAAPQSYGSRAGWQEKTYTLANGHWVYVEPDRKNCEIHYEVNGENIIIGYTPVGSGCKHQ
ncbi:MAG: hypothetical protein R3F24_01595 [Gammaproteobacteria bacterium]